MRYYRQAEDAREPSAKAAIGHMYQDGLGVERNPQLAIGLFEQGAAANDLASVEYLAQTYEFGKGVLINNDLARKFYTQALSLGSEIAEDWLETHPVLPMPGTTTRQGPAPLLVPTTPVPAPGGGRGRGP